MITYIPKNAGWSWDLFPTVWKGLREGDREHTGMAIFPRRLTDAVKNQVHAQEAQLLSSALHRLLSAHLSEGISTEIGRFSAHRRSHPNTIWWKQETLGAICASGFSKWVVISPAVPVKCCPVSFCQRITRKWKNIHIFLCKDETSYLDQAFLLPQVFGWIIQLYNP